MKNDPRLEALGDRLERSVAADLRAEHRVGGSVATAARRTRPRLLAGGTLGLAGIGAALMLVLSAGGAAAPVAFAITTNHDGSLTVDLSDPGEGLFPLNAKLAKMGYDEHINFTMAQGPASSPGVVSCVASPQGASVPGPAINVTVGPGDSNTETIASGNTGAGTWHVASCQRYSGADAKPVPVSGSGASFREVPVKGTRRPLAAKLASSSRRASARPRSVAGPVALNLDTDGGLVGANRKLAALGTDEHIGFTMAQGPAAASGVLNCTPANASVSGPAVTVTVGPGDSNTETIPAGNTGAGTWHVASCTRYAGTETRSLRVEG